jgi:hypothetical protein
MRIGPRRKLKPFREVTKSVDVDQKVRRLAEALNVMEPRRNTDGNPRVNLNYFSISIPMSLSEDDRMERLSDVVDTINAIDGSDVVLLGMWISPF